MSTAMPVFSISARTPTSGISTSVSSRRPPAFSTWSESSADRSSAARACTIALRATPSSASSSANEHPLVLVAGLCQLAVEVAQAQVRQVVGALVGRDQVGGERGVLDDALQRPALGGEREQLALDVVQHLRSRLVRQPGRQRLVVVEAHGLDVDVRRPAVREREGDPGDAAGAAPPRAADADADGLGARLREPAGDGVGSEGRALELDARLHRDVLAGRHDVEDPGPQLAADLELVEQLAARPCGPSPGGRSRRSSRRGAGRGPAR